MAAFEFFATATWAPFVSTELFAFRVDDPAGIEVRVDQLIHFLIWLPRFFDVSHYVKSRLASCKRRQYKPFVRLATLLVRQRDRP